MGTLKVASVNVRGLRDALKRRAVFEFLSNLRFDIFLLQEVHLRDGGDIKAFSAGWKWGDSRWGSILLGWGFCLRGGIFIVWRGFQWYRVGY